MQARRLKNREQFQALLKSMGFVRTEHFVMHRLVLQTLELAPLAPPLAAFENGKPGSWLGAMVPKRWARRAVTRNLIKRQIYSFELPAELTMQNTAYLVRLRSVFDRQNHKSASSEVLRGAVRAEIEQLYSKAARAVCAS